MIICVLFLGTERYKVLLLSCLLLFLFIIIHHSSHTVDGQNPAPVDMVHINPIIYMVLYIPVVFRISSINSNHHLGFFQPTLRLLHTHPGAVENQVHLHHIRSPVVSCYDPSRRRGPQRLDVKTLQTKHIYSITPKKGTWNVKKSNHRKIEDSGNGFPHHFRGVSAGSFGECFSFTWRIIPGIL